MTFDYNDRLRTHSNYNTAGNTVTYEWTEDGKLTEMNQSGAGLTDFTVDYAPDGQAAFYKHSGSVTVEGIRDPFGVAGACTSSTSSTSPYCRPMSESHDTRSPTT